MTLTENQQKRIKELEKTVEQLSERLDECENAIAEHEGWVRMMQGQVVRLLEESGHVRVD